MVTVLLAVYNGEKYLFEQINSILSQTVEDIKIIIRDDGSDDNSPLIIDDFCKKYPQKISKISGTPTGSAKTNFAELLKYADSDYIMFCDQDDVWKSDKIEKTLSAMIASEQNGNIPVLVHTDLTVADEKLNIISNSFFEFQRLNQEKVNLPALLVQNYVTGCTVMINRSLKEFCGDIPQNCIMHDWWLALVAQLFGKIVCVNEPTLFYRQHSGNQVGAKASYGIALIKRKLKTLGEVKKNYNDTYKQSGELLDRYADKLSENQREILENYLKIKNMNKFQKIYAVEKYGFKKGTLLRVIGQYFLM